MTLPIGDAHCQEVVVYRGREEWSRDSSSRGCVPGSFQKRQPPQKKSISHHVNLDESFFASERIFAPVKRVPISCYVTLG